MKKLAEFVESEEIESLDDFEINQFLDLLQIVVKAMLKSGKHDLILKDLSQ